MNRVTPNLPSDAYQTFTIDSPSDRTVKAACADVACEAYAAGWETAIDESTDLGRAQADYIRARSGRTFRELHSAEHGVTVFRFDPGQRCFAEHFTRPEAYAVRHGDWRGRLAVVRRHATAADWVDDFGTHQLQLAEAIEKG